MGRFNADHWLRTRKEMLMQIGWIEPESLHFFWNIPDEYRAMLAALSKECQLQEIADIFRCSVGTIQLDKKRAGLTKATPGGSNRKKRMFAYKGQLLPCAEIAALEGVGYDTAYNWLTKGRLS
jgi:hypothetical protein